jgi:hypothetical protein
MLRTVKQGAYCTARPKMGTPLHSLFLPVWQILTCRNLRALRTHKSLLKISALRREPFVIALERDLNFSN